MIGFAVAVGAAFALGFRLAGLPGRVRAFRAEVEDALNAGFQ